MNHYHELRHQPVLSRVGVKSSDALAKVVSAMIKTAEGRPPKTALCAWANMKAKQCARIAELRFALMESGFDSLDEQARVLGLCRSTTWTLLRANHKASGLSATLINRMWLVPQMPELVRATILQYVEEKATGVYGHNQKQRRKFIQQLSIDMTASSAQDMGLEPFSNSQLRTTHNYAK
jgi:hypothetical protein